MFSSRAVSTISEALYLIILFITTGFFILSCVTLLSQAVRTSPNQSWKGNFNALVIGASYVIVVGACAALRLPKYMLISSIWQLVLSLAFCLNRKIAVRRRLQRISKTHRAIGRGDVPKVFCFTGMNEVQQSNSLQVCPPVYITGICSCVPSVIRGIA